jgi:FkbM family methyltransferase
VKKLRKVLVKVLAKIKITPYVYYTNKWNNPLIIKKNIFYSVSDLVIFDVGAFDRRSIEMCEKVFQKIKVYAFEPTSDMFNHLMNLYKNRQDITLFNFALSSNAGEAPFFINYSSLTNSLFKSGNNGYTKSELSYENTGRINVKTTTIDEICLIHKIPKINILKIDAQGADLLVLKGAENTLKNRKIDLIYVEVEFLQLYENQSLYHELSSCLHSQGYNLYSLYNISVSKKGQMVYGDAVFLSPNIKV